MNRMPFQTLLNIENTVSAFIEKQTTPMAIVNSKTGQNGGSGRLNILTEIRKNVIQATIPVINANDVPSKVASALSKSSMWSLSGVGIWKLPATIFFILSAGSYGLICSFAIIFKWRLKRKDWPHGRRGQSDGGMVNAITMPTALRTAL